MKKVRCAIYTRKSSEEGLEQGFNSLDAQREACAAYVMSQASEGWHLLPDLYDDGGLSGGTLERPALQRLLADIAAGRIDIIVVYKVDRLTRSLLDFAKLVEAFDAAGVSFVSITQSFNTTTSMGRLTLNMLLSFAQFEREVTAERIRDKIAASKARGMWMGGTPPLGYRPDGRSLAIVEEHAAIVRDIYRRYLELGNVRLVADALDREAIRTPARSTATGSRFGGVAFTRGQIYAILNNPIYIGQIRHRDRTYPGNHPAILDRERWDAVQAMLVGNTNGERQASVREPGPLAGMLFDAAGEPMVSVHATKLNVRYRYYVSRSIQHGGDASNGRGMRVPAREIETVVLDRLVQTLRDPLGLATRLDSLPVGSGAIEALIANAATITTKLQKSAPAQRKSLLQTLIDRIEIGDASVQIHIAGDRLGKELGLHLAGPAPRILLDTPVVLRRNGMAMRLILEDGGRASRVTDLPLLRAIARGRVWWKRLAANPGMTNDALAKAEGVNESYVTRIVRLAFVDPIIIERIIDGTAPAAINLPRLLKADAISGSWVEQRNRFGIA